MKLQIVLMAGFLLGVGASTAAPSFGWDQTDVSIALKNGANTVWRFYYGTDKDKPFFHPLALVDGTELTDESHPNHPWHHGLWFSWKTINGASFWEEKGKFQKATGKNGWSDVRVKTDGHAASISMKLTYALPGAKKPVLREKRTMKVSVPNAEGTYSIDWQSVFTATDDVVLDRTPLSGQPGGKSGGGYAGLSVRVKGTATDVQAHTEKGIVENWIKKGSSRNNAWSMDYSALIDGKPAGFTIVDQPGNLNAPTVWYAIDAKMKYFSPAVIHNQPHKLKAGESMELNYRIYVHEGRWSADVLKELIGSD